jgi:hypothetical protein
MKGSFLLSPVWCRVWRLLVIVLLCLRTSGGLFADSASVQAARAAITAQLEEYAKQLGETDLRQRNLLSAKADRIAQVVRELVLMNETRNTKFSLGDLVAASLIADPVSGTNSKKDDVALEVVRAVVDQAGIAGDGAKLKEVVTAALSVNSDPLNPVTGTNVISKSAKQKVVAVALREAGSSSVGRDIADAAYEFVISPDSGGGLSGASGAEASAFLVEVIKQQFGMDPKGAVSGLVSRIQEQVESEPDQVVRTSFYVDKILKNRTLSGVDLARALGEVVGALYQRKPLDGSLSAEEAARLAAAADVRLEQDLAGLINNTIRGTGSRISGVLPHAVGAAAANYQGNKTRLAEQLIANLNRSNQTPEIRGQIFSGFLRGVGEGSASEVQQVLVTFLDTEYDYRVTSNSPAVKVGKVATAADLQRFINSALTGNGVGGNDLQDEARKVLVTTQIVADRIGQTFVNSKTKSVDWAKAFAAADDLGTGLIGKLVGTNPDAAGAVAKGIIEGYKVRGFFPQATIVQDVTNFVSTLCRNRGANTFSANNAAMSSLVGAAIDFFPSTDQIIPQLDENGNPVIDQNGVPVNQIIKQPEVERERMVTLATNLIRAAPKAVYSVAARASKNLENSQLSLFAQGLALQTATTKEQVTQIAVGVAMNDPNNVGLLTKNLVLMTKTTIERGKSVSRTPFVTSAEAIAGGVARAVSVESAADIAQALVSTVSATSAITFKEVQEIAASVALAINQKQPTVAVPGVNRPDPVRTYNRVDELGELAAVLVGSVLGKAQGQNAEFELVKAIGVNILSALTRGRSPEGLYESADASPSIAADGRFVSAAADIIGCIAQVISYSSAISETQKNFLLRSQSSLGSASREVTLEKALIEAALARSALTGVARTNYQNILLGVFKEVRDAGIGNLVAGEETVGQNGIKAADSVLKGKYEIGSVNDPETPVNNGL